MHQGFSFVLFVPSVAIRLFDCLIGRSPLNWLPPFLVECPDSPEFLEINKIFNVYPPIEIDLFLMVHNIVG